MPAPGAVHASGAIEEHRKLIAAALRCGQEAVARTIVQRERVDLVAFRGTRPAAPRQHHRHRLTCDQLCLVQGLRRFALDNLGAAFVAIGFRIFEDLFLDERLEPRRTIERLLKQVSRSSCNSCCSPLILNLLKLGEIAQTQVEDCFSLDIGQFEALHQHRLSAHPLSRMMAMTSSILR